MNGCESYELHVSALLDGEASREDVLSLLDHLPRCDACRDFYAAARQLQQAMDAQPVNGHAVAALEASAAPFGREQTRRPHTRPPLLLPSWPRAVWASAAALLVAVGFWVFDTPAQRQGARTPGILDVELGEHAGQMSEQQFVDLAVQLLQADRRLQHTMLELLQEVERPLGSREGTPEVARYRPESMEESATGRESIGVRIY